MACTTSSEEIGPCRLTAAAKPANRPARADLHRHSEPQRSRLHLRGKASIQVHRAIAVHYTPWRQTIMDTQVRLRIHTRELLAEGMAFGEVGPYERLAGQVL